MTQSLYEKRCRRQRRNRFSLKASAPRGVFRLSVFRSGRNVSLQIIDDEKQMTLTSASSLEAEIRKKSLKGKDLAFLVGETLGKRAKDKNLKKVFFDRGMFMYHGRVRAAAEGARQAGLNF